MNKVASVSALALVAAGLSSTPSSAQYETTRVSAVVVDKLIAAYDRGDKAEVEKIKAMIVKEKTKK